MPMLQAAQPGNPDKPLAARRQGATHTELRAQPPAQQTKQCDEVLACCTRSHGHEETMFDASAMTTKRASCKVVAIMSMSPGASLEINNTASQSSPGCYAQLPNINVKNHPLDGSPNLDLVSRTSCSSARL